MVDSYSDPRDESSDYNSDFEDWSVEGSTQDAERQEVINYDIENQERESMEEYRKELEHFESTDKAAKSEVEELNKAKKVLLALLREIKTKEGDLMDQYECIWNENPDGDNYKDGHYDYFNLSEKEKIEFDFSKYYDYELITSWINRYPIIEREMTEDEKRCKLLEEVRLKKESNLREHKRKLGIPDDPIAPY